MAQFDVRKIVGRGPYPLVLEVQADVLDRLERRVVVPMVARRKYGEKPIPRLNPVVVVAGTEYVLLVHDLASVPTSLLGERVDSLPGVRNEVIAAIDLLFTGT